MAVVFYSSYVLYQGCIEWYIRELRDCLEIAKFGKAFTKRSPEVEFTVPLKEDEGRSCPIYWHVAISRSHSDHLEGKPAFRVHVSVKPSSSIGKFIGIRASLSFSDAGSNFEDRMSYSYISPTCDSDIFFKWVFNLASIPQSCSLVKLLCNFVAYDMDDEAMPSSTKLSSSSPLSLNHMNFSEELTQSLNRDRIEGINTDAVLRHGDAEYKVHKNVLAVQSEFFKVRFSDRWHVTDGAVHSVDMNDTDLNPDIIELLLCSAYTGKVENLEMAAKLLPVTDKYQFKKLKTICEAKIGSQLKKDNVLEMYGLAKFCNAQALMAKCESLVKL